jgi:hypothetical protein
MMQKMGYQSGKGLGAREQGITAPIEMTDNKKAQGLGLLSSDASEVRELVRPVGTFFYISQALL